MTTSSFNFQFYVRTDEIHPADVTADGVTLEHAAELFKGSMSNMGTTFEQICDPHSPILGTGGG